MKDKSIERAAKVYLYRIIISKHHRSYAARALCFTNSTNPSIGRWNRDRRIRSEGHKEKINVFVVTRSPLFPFPIFETLIPKTRLQNQDPRFRVPDPASPFTLTFPSSLHSTSFAPKPTRPAYLHQTPKKTQKQSADPSILSRRTHPPLFPLLGNKVEQMERTTIQATHRSVLNRSFSVIHTYIHTYARQFFSFVRFFKNTNHEHLPLSSRFYCCWSSHLLTSCRLCLCEDPHSTERLRCLEESMEEYGRACERWVGGWREEGGGRRRECWRVKICGVGRWRTNRRFREMMSSSHL